MASGHVSRIKRPNTWLHRPMLQNVKKALANSEPSTHGATSRRSLRCNDSSAIGDKAESGSQSDRRIYELTAWSGNRLRARRNLLKRINLICPVQPHLQKYSPSL